MQVIRIEHPNCGNGIYRAVDENNTEIHKKFSFHKEMIENHKQLPTPHQENLFFTNEYFCSFKSLQKFYQWIPQEYISEILQYGFRIFMIELHWMDCVIGTEQICFKKEYIKKKIDISDLFVIISN